MTAQVIAGAFSGFLAAAAVDFHAFASWKRVEDAMTYNWKVAVFRWVQGAVAGAIGGLSLSGGA